MLFASFTAGLVVIGIAMILIDLVFWRIKRAREKRSLGGRLMASIYKGTA